MRLTSSWEEIGLGLPSSERPAVVAIVGSMLNAPLIYKVIDEHEIDTIYRRQPTSMCRCSKHNEVVGVETTSTAPSCWRRRGWTSAGSP